MAKVVATGSRREVYNGTAKHTSGGLTKSDLKKTADGRIRSKRASAAAKKKLAHNPKFKKYIKMAKEQKGKKFKKMTKLRKH